MRLVDQIARLRNLTKQAAVKLAVQAELACMENAVPLRDRIAALRTTHTLPQTTGHAPERKFFDELTGEA